MGSRSPLRGTSPIRPRSTPPTSTRRAPVYPPHSSGKLNGAAKKNKNKKTLVCILYVTCNYMYLPILYTFIRIYIPAPPSPSAKSSIFVARHFPRKLMIQDRVLCTCSDFLFHLSYPYLLRYRPHPIPFHFCMQLFRKLILPFHNIAD